MASVCSTASQNSAVWPWALHRKSGSTSSPRVSGRCSLYTGRGLFYAETAAELVISENTARVRVLRILAKLQLRDQAQAVVRAHRLGLAPASEWASALGDLTSWKVNA